jgi:hypothetical protein
LRWWLGDTDMNLVLLCRLQCFICIFPASQHSGLWNKKSPLWARSTTFCVDQSAHNIQIDGGERRRYGCSVEPLVDEQLADLRGSLTRSHPLALLHALRMQHFGSSASLRSCADIPMPKRLRQALRMPRRVSGESVVRWMRVIIACQIVTCLVRLFQ